MEPVYEAVQVLPNGEAGIIIARGTEQHVKDMALKSQIHPYEVVLTQESDIRLKYWAWRKANGNRRPNRVIVRKHWEDETIEDANRETIGLITKRDDDEKMPDDNHILYYVRSLKELIRLTEPHNGSDFIVDEVIEFYKYE